MNLWKIMIGEKSMSLTNDVQKVKSSITKTPKDIFLPIDLNAETYWENRDNEFTMAEFNFNTPMELKALFDKYIEDEELKRLLVAEAFKRKNSYMSEKKDAEKSAKSTQLPEFVYAF